jgi:hypothetical protein
MIVSNQEIIYTILYNNSRRIEWYIKNQVFPPIFEGFSLEWVADSQIGVSGFSSLRVPLSKESETRLENRFCALLHTWVF